MDLSRFLEESEPFSEEEKAQIYRAQNAHTEAEEALAKKDFSRLGEAEREYEDVAKKIAVWLDGRHLATNFCSEQGVSEEAIDTAYREATLLAAQMMLPSKVMGEEAMRQRQKGNEEDAQKIASAYEQICKVSRLEPIYTEPPTDEFLQALKEFTHEVQDDDLDEDSPIAPYLSPESTFTLEERASLAQLVRFTNIFKETGSKEAKDAFASAVAVVSGWLDQRDSTLKFAHTMGVSDETIDRAYAESAGLARLLDVPSDVLGAEATRLEAKGEHEAAQELAAVYETLCEKYNKEPEYPESLASVAEAEVKKAKHLKVVKEADEMSSAMEAEQKAKEARAKAPLEIPTF